MTLKLLLMGTGEFAVPAFAALADGPHQVVGLVTQPDRGGPGHHAPRHPLELIKSACLEQGVPVLQPPKVNDADAIAAIAALAPDLAVVAAYGQILRPELIGVPRLGAINLHASLLPRHRGATPIHHAILAGDTQTGVSVFQIEPAVATGPMLGVVRTEIGPRETTGGLHDRLSELAVGLASQVAGFYGVGDFALVVKQLHFGAGGDVQAGFDGAAVAQRNAGAGIGAQQAAFAQGNDDVAAARQGAHGGRATADVGAFTYKHASGDAAFDHARAFSACVKVDEAFVHDGSAFTHISAQANP